MEGVEKIEKKCCVPACTDTCYSVLRVGTEEQVANLLECESLPYPTPLQGCQPHVMKKGSFNDTSIAHTLYRFSYLDFFESDVYVAESMVI